MQKQGSMMRQPLLGEMEFTMEELVLMLGLGRLPIAIEGHGT